LSTVDTAENLDRAGGRIMRLLLDSATTDAGLSVLACEAPGDSSGPPLHIHPHTDETFFVVWGTLLLSVDGVTHTLHKGACGFVPRGTAHTFATAGAEAVRFLTIHTPGGFEQMHREVCAAEREAGRALEPAEIIPIAQRHDWTLVGPPLLPSGVLAGAAAR
jgi:mannose-6-phosphate isomerase-like protein (cupin superfamily)